MKQSTQSWLDSGEYLPAIMRDFHDQKDIFKAMHEIIDTDKNEYAKKVSWVSGHCYVVDVFLWFMARRGYTLQRSRKQVIFNDLQSEVNHVKKHRELSFKI